MKFTLFCLLACQAFFSFGHIELYTSIEDVYRLGTDQVPGQIVMRFTGDEFTLVNGKPVSPTNPVYIRVSLDRNAVLSRTIVDPTGVYTQAKHNAMSDVPIDLMLTSHAPQFYKVAGNLPEYAVQLVRGIQGEHDIWLRISVPTSNWVDTDMNGTGDSPPSLETPLSIAFALDRGLANNRMGESGFLFEDIEKVDTYDAFGFDSPQSDSRFFVNYSPEGCPDTDSYPLHAIDILAFSTLMEPGGPGSPETAPATKIAAPECHSPGVDIGPFEFLPTTFAGDFAIARLLDESTMNTRLFAPEVVQVGQSFDLVNQVLGDNIALRVSWNFGVEKLITNDTKITYAFDKEGEYTVVSTAVNGNGASSESTAVIMVTSLESTPDITQLQTQALTPDQALLTWRSGSIENADLEKFIVSAEVEGVAGYTLLGETTSTRFLARGLHPGRTYNFNVEPEYSGGVMGASVKASITLPAQEDALPFRFRISHISEAPDAWDSLAVLNPYNASAKIELRAMNQSGLVIAVSDKLTELEPGQKSKGMFNDYFSDQTLQQATWIELASNRELSSFQLSGEKLEKMAAIRLNHEAMYSGEFLNAQAEGGNGVELELLNTTENEARVVFTAWFGSGPFKTEITKLIPPRGKLQMAARDLFGSRWKPEFEWLTWSSDQPLVSSQRWGQFDDVVSGLQSQAGGSVVNILPHVTPGSLISLTNRATTENQLVLDAFTNDGNLVTSTPLTLQPQGRISSRTPILAGADFTGYLVIKSTGPLNCQSEFHLAHDWQVVMGDTVAGLSEMGGTFFFPHIPNMKFWITKLMVINNSIYEERVIFTAYDANGTTLKTHTETLPPHGRFDKSVETLFGQIDNIAYVRALSLRPNLAAHLLFYTKPDKIGLMGGMSPSPIQ